MRAPLKRAAQWRKRAEEYRAVADNMETATAMRTSTADEKQISAILRERLPNLSKADAAALKRFERNEPIVADDLETFHRLSDEYMTLRERCD
jgi:hypothetical protein